MIKFNGFVAKEVYLGPKKERSIRKYGKSPKEVSFFERNTGHPGFGRKKLLAPPKKCPKNAYANS